MVHGQKVGISQNGKVLLRDAYDEAQVAWPIGAGISQNGYVLLRAPEGCR